MKARVFVTLKPSVFDPQGHTITEALHQMGYGGVDDVRQGKYFELNLPGTSADQAQDAGRRSRAEAAGQSGHRELSHRGRRMKFAIVVFPGSNCDHDAYHATKHVLGQDAEFVWHKETDLKGADVVILPGGFAHGDYLRTGAIARFSPVMDAVRAFAAAGNPLIGICNGFQVLLEAELLPGAMLRNTDKYKCEYVYARVEQTDTPFTNLCAKGQVLKIPIAHGEGNYYADPETVAGLEANRQVIFRYVSPERRGDARSPTRTGRFSNIAGICNAGAQRRRPDAAPRACVRIGARQRRWQGGAGVGRVGVDCADLSWITRNGLIRRLRRLRGFLFRET